MNPEDGTGGDVDTLTEQVARLTLELRQAHADCANLRRQAAAAHGRGRQDGVVALLADLVSVLDDLERAEAHDELTGGFGIVANKLRTQLDQLGLVRYGAPEDPFDPAIHHALLHLHSAEATDAVCSDVLAPGYLFQDRTVRPATVVVTSPGPAVAGQPTHAAP